MKSSRSKPSNCAALPVASSARRRRKPPSVAFRIAGAVLPLAIGLVHGLGVDGRTGAANTLEMGINIVNMHDETGALHACCERGRESVFRCNAVQPDGRLPSLDLTMYRLALGVTRDASCFEPEHLHQKIVSCLYVLVHEKRDDAIESWHGFSSFVSAQPLAFQPRRLTALFIDEHAPRMPPSS